MDKQFDLIVIGTGAAGSPVAYKCQEAGWSVAIIDSHPFGGTCALRGCDPKKVLVGAADVVDWARRMRGKGVAAEHAEINWSELMRFKRSFTDLTPVASMEAQVVAANILEGNDREPNYTGVPSVVFTLPPLAAVGLGEDEARKQGLKFRDELRRYE